MQIGEAVQCWSASECTKKMMELASKGIVTEEEPKGSNRLVVKMITEENQNE